MKTEEPFVSLIIPVYNEQKRLSHGLSGILSYLMKQPYSWEIILVDDGSRVPVKVFLEDIGKTKEFPYDVASLPISLYRLPRNTGKGAAIALGVKKAVGTYIVFCDIDLSVPITNLSQVIARLKRYPVVIASRRLAQSRIVVHQTVIREFSGRIYTALSNILCKTAVADVTCGFKGFRGDIAKLLFAKRRINRWVFDTEIVFLARRHKYPVSELPVAWADKTGSKVQPFDAFWSLGDLLRVRWYAATGKYE